jgi:ankyrin repeat protein
MWETSNGDGVTSFHAAVAHDDSAAHESVIRLLASLGADINTPMNNGATPLWIAAHDGRNSMVRLLVSLEADINRPRDGWWTPLMTAAYGGRDGVAAGGSFARGGVGGRSHSVGLGPNAESRSGRRPSNCVIV